MNPDFRDFSRTAFISLRTPAPGFGKENLSGALLRIAEGEVRLSHGHGGQLSVLVPVTETAYRSFRPDTRGQAIKVTAVRVEGTPHIRVRLELPRFEDTYMQFTDALLRDLKDADGPSETIILRAIQDWRNMLLLSIPTGQIPVQEEIGILCELEVLRSLIHRDGPAVLRRWTGPEKSRHDFELDGISVECKATTASNGLPVVIHGAEQLTESPGKRLDLAVRRYVPDPDGTMSVPSLRDSICAIPGVDTRRFLSSLSSLGVAMADRDESGEKLFRRYSPGEAVEFVVSDGFPRLTGIGTTGRIQQVSYTVDLSDPGSITGYRAGNLYLNPTGAR
ncbi:PD-(D/E)XK motif protein [Corynebacterium sp. CCM 8835]|uniref:PD-(D/E)XK motif protein n=1 Tax=Corynebacterium antarcticum TaxID=2800405 RepID=A0ABS1FMX3_9CORY|nr:PD-(D/E)XK motif protein [Corynebacterium antarcticum]MCL0246206.1 PD-(D/E)XK motif protein [Corynebacterium antarcticum]MCX7492457.1 PD-(D/E)XK motif protein [Corynebacterium antarcticum]MCX7540797.1 PD-(D/E)XK motif protein [Corynebacterium antarcticum]